MTIWMTDKRYWHNASEITKKRRLRKMTTLIVKEMGKIYDEKKIRKNELGSYILSDREFESAKDEAILRILLKRRKNAKKNKGI